MVQRTPSIKQKSTFQILDVQHSRLPDGDAAPPGGSANASLMSALEVSTTELDASLSASPVVSGGSGAGGRRASNVAESDVDASPRSAATGEMSPDVLEMRDCLSASASASTIGSETHDGLGPPRGPSRFKVSKVPSGEKDGLGKTVRRQRFEVTDTEATASSGHMPGQQQAGNRGTLYNVIFHRQGSAASLFALYLVSTLSVRSASV